MTLEAGETVAGYEVLGQVGAGGMATVYKAWHERLDRHAALKLLHSSFVQDDGFLERFEREARIVARLDHPHIVPVYDYAEHNGVPFFVMKYIEGGTLKRRLIKHGITLDEIMRMMTQLADALTYAHEKAVLHRDIKPSNILIDERGLAYLTDFGLARIAEVGDSTISHDMMLGTPHYISPEQAKGERYLTPATDVYSFGIILYELLAGVLPFSGDTPYAIVHEHIYTPPPRPSALNPELTAAVDAVLLKALAKDPERRYQSASALMVDFKSALADSGVTHLPPDRSVAEPNPYPSRQSTYQPNMEDERIPALSREDFTAEAEQIKELAHGMREKLKTNRAKRKKKVRSRDDEIRKRVEQKFRARRGFLIHLLIYLAVFGIAALDLVLGAWSGPNAFLDIIAPAQLWGLGLALHSVHYYFKHGPAAEQREVASESEISREIELYGAIADDERSIRDCIAKKFRARRAIATHIVVFLVFGLPIFLFDLFGPSRADQIATIGIWGLIIGLQCWRYYYRHGRGAEMREDEIDNEISRQLELSQVREEKRHRRLYDEEGDALEFESSDGRHVRLNDEGELTESFVEETAQSEKQKRE